MFMHLLSTPHLRRLPLLLCLLPLRLYSGLHFLASRSLPTPDALYRDRSILGTVSLQCSIQIA